MTGSTGLTGSYETVVAELYRLPVNEQIFAVLAHDLAPTLHYHAVQHSRDVFEETVRFALHDQIDARKIELLSIAAAYHDAGYMEQYADNEPIGAAMASRAMKQQGGYTQSEINEVSQMILSTQLKVTPEGGTRVELTPFAGYLMDADLGSFGREDFFEKCQQLIDETGAPPEALYQQAWRLISNHIWYTRAARELREAKRQQNLKELEIRLKSLSSSN